MGKRKRHHVAKSGPLVINAELVWQTKKPRYNGYACGYGKHGDNKYNRAREKRGWQRDFDSRSSGKGLLPFWDPVSMPQGTDTLSLCCLR